MTKEIHLRMKDSFAICSADKGITSRIYSELKKSNTNRTDNPLNK
jgi:hypothetical protein